MGLYRASKLLKTIAAIIGISLIGTVACATLFKETPPKSCADLTREKGVGFAFVGYTNFQTGSLDLVFVSQDSTIIRHIGLLVQADRDNPANAGETYEGKCTAPNGGYYWVLIKDLLNPAPQSSLK